jgi:hypothetical protein
MPCITSRRQQYVLHGTLTTFRRRCGKPTCRCATGDPHETPALVYTEGGRSKTVTLRGSEVDEVAAALARYEAARDDLESAAREGLAALKQRRSRGRGRS